MKRTVTRSLVHRLRAPMRRGTEHQSADMHEKLDAIGEALAYLIEKKKLKRSVKKAKRGRT